MSTFLVMLAIISWKKELVFLTESEIKKNKSLRAQIIKIVITFYQSANISPGLKLLRLVM